MGHKGVALLIPALKQINGRYAQACHRFIQQPEIQERLQIRKTIIKPLFDLIAMVLVPSELRNNSQPKA